MPEPVGVEPITFEPPVEIRPEFTREAVTASVTSAIARDDGVPHERTAEDDMPAEVSKLLGKTRWEKRDSPFKGFDSPPGRF